MRADKRYFSLEPEVAGEIGVNSEADFSSFPPVIKKLNYIFHGWLGDDLVESFPCYIVTDKLRAAIEKAGLTGYNFESVVVRSSERFRELYPNMALPAFSRLVPTGVAKVDDFGLSQSYQLIVSEKALEILKNFQLDHCDITEVTASQYQVLGYSGEYHWTNYAVSLLANIRQAQYTRGLTLTNSGRGLLVISEKKPAWHVSSLNPWLKAKAG